MHMRLASLAVAVALSSGLSLDAAAAPLSGAWNIAPSGSAASSGDLLFRVIPGDTEQDPIEVTVSVLSGSSDIAVARDIRRTLSAQLPPARFNVALGQGANVMLTDPRGQPNFSVELVDSDVENLRVLVAPANPTAPPTVPAQSAPATPPNVTTPGTPSAPGNAQPAQPAPTTPSPGNAGQPAAPPPQNSPSPPGSTPGSTPTPGSNPGSAPTPGAAPGSSGGAPASAPPPGA